MDTNVHTLTLTHCLCVCVSLSLSLTLTHTHTYTHILSELLHNGTLSSIPFLPFPRRFLTASSSLLMAGLPIPTFSKSSFLT